MTLKSISILGLNIKTNQILFAWSLDEKTNMSFVCLLIAVFRSPETFGNTTGNTTMNNQLPLQLLHKNSRASLLILILIKMITVGCLIF